ncbi:hypothetical protein JDO7802_01464 [Jannaschia donghaensis]|uniref:Uncharacterized protein n=1 Tax=Jannaschia donghaensis TaxID=420998 RepID=A0A0M6YHL3_9RHOB|nr:hypothetical protein JDO7802_01464 [Jannaschia donghaensis]
MEQLEQDARMIVRPSRPPGGGPFEPKPDKVNILDEEIDDSNRLFFVDPVLQSLRKQRYLVSTDTLNRSRHAHSCLLARAYNTPKFSRSLGP